MTAAIASSAELQEREALKRIGLSVAISTALVERGVEEPVAHLAAEMGVLAFKQGYAAWAADDASQKGFGSYAVAALDTLRKAASDL